VAIKPLSTRSMTGSQQSCSTAASNLNCNYQPFAFSCCTCCQACNCLEASSTHFQYHVQKSRLLHVIALTLFSACTALQEQLLGHNPNTRPDSELCFDMGKQVSAASFDTILTRYGRHSLAWNTPKPYA